MSDVEPRSESRRVYHTVYLDVHAVCDRCGDLGAFPGFSQAEDAATEHETAHNVGASSR